MLFIGVSEAEQVRQPSRSKTLLTMITRQTVHPQMGRNKVWRANWYTNNTIIYTKNIILMNELINQGGRWRGGTNMILKRFCQVELNFLF